MRAAVPTEYRIALRDEADIPIPGAIAVLFRETEILAELRADEFGTLTVAAECASCDVALWAPHTAPPQLLTLDASAEPALRVDRGAVVAGKVLVNGATPVEPIEIGWAPESVDVLQALPKSVSVALLSSKIDALVPRQLSGADGSFRFEGVSKHGAGFLFWASPLTLDSADVAGDVFRLDAPREDVVLRLQGSVAVRGRIIDAAGEPLREGSIRLICGSEIALADIMRDGTFGAILEGGFQRPATLQVERRVYFESFSDHVELQLPSERTSEWDVGDVVVPRMPSVVLVVLGQGNSPIALAQVEAEIIAPDTENSLFTEEWRTDASGRASIPVTSRLARIGVDAPEYVPAALSPPFDTSREVLLRLERAASATLVLDITPKSSARRLYASLLPVHAEEAPTTTDGDWWKASGSRAMPVEVAEFERVPCDTELVARIHDATGRVLHMVPVAPIPLGEHREVLIAFSWSPTTTYLRVKGSDSGERVPRAEILVDGRRFGRTDAVGDAALQDVAPGTVELVVRHPDYVELREPAFVLPTHGQWVELRLSRRTEDG